MKNSKKPVFIYQVCTACGICMQDCPFSCISMSKTGIDEYNKAYPLLTSIETCTGCVICSAACPVNAIVLKELNEIVSTFD